MSTYFVPYSGKKPAALDINGHKLIIVAQNRETLESHMEILGADSVKQLRGGESKAEQELAFGRVAKRAGGGVVLAPQDIEFGEIIKNLEMQLPWLQ